MPSDQSISHWIGQLQSGDPAAAQQLWERYFRRLVALARKRLKGRPLRGADEEDVALSAFDSFCRGAEQGRFPQLVDRDNLWRVLVVITARKALHLLRDEGRQKRGGERALANCAPLANGDQPALEQLVGREPTPEFAAQVAEECQRLLESLQDPILEQVAVWKMEGHTNDEIAAKLNCALRTVERKLGLIRDIWQQTSAS